MKSVEAVDVELFGNYFLVTFKCVHTRKVKAVFEMAEGERIDGKALKRRMKRVRMITFNGNNYDIPIMTMAAEGFSIKKMKEASARIIEDELRSWEIEEEFKISIDRDLDHIDLIEVSPGSASLKIYGGRLHSKRMQDLPYHHDKVLTPEEMDKVYDYNVNDLETTIDLYWALENDLMLRQIMSKEYGVDLRSKSDAQVAEAVIRQSVQKATGKKLKRPEFKANKRYRYTIPDFIRFRSDYLNKLLDDIENSWFKLSPAGKIIIPPALEERDIKIGQTIYRMGVGGLHSTEKRAVHVADDKYGLEDNDVESYYPRIILNLKLFPKHIGPIFLKVFNTIVERRLKAKKDAKKLKDEIKELEARIASSNDGGELMKDRLADLKKQAKMIQNDADGLKITINGSFGKFGSKYSILFSPDLLIQTTITGQLSLLMLAEMLEDAGFEVVSGNTDGIVTKYERARYEEMREIIAKWEKRTNYKTEATPYKAIYSRDINNYFAVKTDGSVKRKGAYAVPGLREKKNPTNSICPEAVAEYITKGTPIAETIRGCKDITKFITVRKVNGGATKDGQYLGSAIRWYMSTATKTAIHYAKANKSGNFNKVPKTEGAMPIMELGTKFPDDVDYWYYIQEARKMLIEIGYHEDLLEKKARKPRKLADVNKG